MQCDLQRLGFLREMNLRSLELDDYCDFATEVWSYMMWPTTRLATDVGNLMCW